MRSSERFELVLKHREPDRVPIHDSPWTSTVDRWRSEGLPSGITPADYFGFEMAVFSADTSPQLPVEILQEDETHLVEKDPFGGIRKNYRDFSSTPMVIDFPCKNRQDWEDLKPRLKASEYRVDWVSGLQAFHRERSRGRFITYSAGVGLTKIQNYVGFEQLLRNIIMDPEWVKDMYQADAKLTMEMCECMMRGGFQFNGAFIACDLGYRKGPLLSPKHFEDQLHPVFKELFQFFHNRGLPVILHCCGGVKDLIPYFIEEGIDCLQPLEVKAGMNLIELKTKYGDRLSFMGGIDVRLMSLDDPRPLENEIKEKFAVAKEGGGYIYHSDHSIPKDVSFQQYKRVMDLVRQYGKYD